METLNRNRKFNIDMTYREDVLTAISAKIEAKYGRKKPKICEYRDYEVNKEKINKEIHNKKHFNEKDWPDFESILLENVKSSQLNQDYDTISSESDEDKNLVARSPESSASRFRNVKINSYKPPSVLERLGPSHIREDSPGKQRKILTPRELSETSNAKMQEKYVVEKYKTSVEIAIKQLEKNFKDYEKNPEKHPQYSDEWKAFWSRRYKELIGQGKDANGHDYKPEWIDFWTKRMKDLLKIDIDKKKESFRKSLGLSIDAVMKIENEPSTSRGRRSRSRSRSPRKQRKRDSPIKISDDSDDDRGRRPSKKSRVEQSRKSEERSRSRFSEDSPYSRHSDSRHAYEAYANRYRESERMKSKSPEIVDDGPVNIISVCRLLSALESELGLLAKSVIDLLGKAVALEKLKPNSADELLLTSDNCNVLETIKEKLKGILTANLIAANKIIAVKRAIKNIATLLHEVSKRKPSTSVDVSNTESTTKIRESMDDIDPIATAKLEIAAVITQSLFEQGRTDVSSEELEALVSSFMESADGEQEEEEIKEEPKVVKAEPTPTTSNGSATLHSKKNDKESSGGSNALENLTDEDLQTLLRNFADLTSDEQTHLISYLSKIEQTNPARVEKLRKFVNVGENEDNNDGDFDERNLDMDLAAGVSEPSTSRRKSPEPMRHELSDDDYDDDAMAKQLGSNGSHTARLGESSKINGGPSRNTLKDNSGLADSLMSSLMQSSTSSNTWEMHPQSNIDIPAAFYQQPPATNYQNNLYDQQMSMPMNFGLQMQQQPMQMQQQPIPFSQNQMNIPFGQNEAPWLQSAASFFRQEVEIPKEFANKNEHKGEKVAYRKRYDNPNNRQLTGKGKFRH